MSLVPFKDRDERLLYIDQNGSGLVMYKDKLLGNFGPLKVLVPGVLSDAARLADASLLAIEGAQITSSTTGKLWQVIGGVWGNGVTPVMSNHPLVSGAWTVPLPTHLPVLVPEMHSALAPITVGTLTASYDATVKERGLGSIKFASTGGASGTVRLPLAPFREFGNSVKVAARVHFRVRCDDWSKVTALHLSLTQDGGSANCRQFRIVSANKSRYGCTDPAYAAKWNNQWRTLVDYSDKSAKIGAAADWGMDNKYFAADGLLVALQATGAVNLWFDRIYSPDWSVGFFVPISDGAYKSALDAMVPAFAQRGWKFGASINQADGATSGVTTYPTTQTIVDLKAAGHDVFMHGHSLTAGGAIAEMGATVTEQNVYESLVGARANIAQTNPSNNQGLAFHQWLQNKGTTVPGVDVGGLLSELGVVMSRAGCADSEFGYNGMDTAYSNNGSWSGYPAGATGASMCGWSSAGGRYNVMYSEFFAGQSTPELRDTFEGSALQKSIRYAANCGDGVVNYTHNIIAYDGTNPTQYDSGINQFNEMMRELDTQVAAGKLLVLSPSQLIAATYSRPGPVYLRWDGEWCYRSDNTIAF